ncbi:acyl-protein thioesterase [Annulohypoxylon maeteangense]|uniref:acyl-protein thioesterase n=1 Tax=Annulohypoxylon maeteangense TaxID=1927788 RepID=UPI00200783C5|nr:acyl-protein thioesterase [Annulohypoxylon maeteangense]KAI0882321.1 acyl-protein thioesterase [Annulohypoxylon maeteangense]
MASQSSLISPSASSSTNIYIVEPTTAHTHTIILLHGLSSNGEKFGKELLETGITSANRSLAQLLPGTRFVFPTAKRRRSSAFNRAVLTQWFDIARLPDPEYRKQIQLKGLAESAAELEPLIREETSKVSPQNVILGGLSQGCAMSLSMLLALEYPLGGFIGMCGYLPFRTDMDEAIAHDDMEMDEDNPFATEAEGQTSSDDPAVKTLIFERDLLCLSAIPNPKRENTSRSTPVFLGHGDADEKKPYHLGEGASLTMQTAGYEVVWKLYQGLGHWYKIPDEVDDIVDFIQKKVGWDISQ